MKKVMVCVTRQKTCERLIREGARIASENGTELCVVHAVKSGINFLGNPKEAEALEYLFSVSKQFGAEMTVLRAESVEDVLVQFAKKNKVGHIVAGSSPQGDGGFNAQLARRLPDVAFTVL